MEDEDNTAYNNVVVFPTMISNGQNVVLSKDLELSVADAKKMALDKILELGNTSNSVLALCIDKRTGTPTLVLGGLVDPSYVNIFLDLVKDELKEMFRASNTLFVPDSEFTDDGD